jgi:hypothetical protein
MKDELCRVRFPPGSIRGRVFSQDMPFVGSGSVGAQRQGALVEGVEHPQFLRDVARGERVTEGAFAGENLCQVEGHGVSRNWRLNLCQASVR